MEFLDGKAIEVLCEKGCERVAGLPGQDVVKVHGDTVTPCRETVNKPVRRTVGSDGQGTKALRSNASA